MTPTLRPMQAQDAEGVTALAEAAFRDLNERQGRPSAPPAPLWAARHHHLLAIDPRGQWVAEDDHGLAGAACAVVRERLWVLSLLVVRPGVQSAGLGRRLLDAALTTSEGTAGGLIASSSDPRAMRRYALAGFGLLPTLTAEGVVNPDALEPARGVREGGLGDLPRCAELDRGVRGAAHGPDLELLLTGEARLLIADGGYALVSPGALVVLAAADERAAGELLRAALLDAPPDAAFKVGWITAAQQWAISVVLAAGLALRPAGPICARGDVGPLAPYLPSGAFL